ncbi:hypothetical protein C4B63_163g39 [Trypanosoma cruzi]|uniref:Cysteine dioxygenase n=1 Tax=Trypanosoma cruzi TaxID=5693 RepID=A0A2V2UQD6_TRYCR|nr:hypothetical protein C4B63_163g39 [Trypanosoma cruzi]
MLNFKTVLQRKGGQFCSASITKALAQLTLLDLKSYVSEEAAQRCMADCNTAISEHAFSLHDALHSSGPNCWKGKFDGRVGCSTLYETDDIALCWFVVPPGGVLPLHDHCTMVVWQRILFGRIHITSFDWAQGFEPVDTQLCNRRGGEAIVVFSGTSEARSNASSPASLVTSFGPHEGGVLHEIENESTEPALFVNVMTPPYNKPPNNIECMYYSLSRLDGGRATPLESQSDAACRERLTVGQRVLLTPRPTVGKMPMNVFIPIQSPW